MIKKVYKNKQYNCIDLKTPHSYVAIRNCTRSNKNGYNENVYYFSNHSTWWICLFYRNDVWGMIYFASNFPVYSSAKFQLKVYFSSVIFSCYFSSSYLVISPGSISRSVVDWFDLIYSKLVYNRVELSTDLVNFYQESLSGRKQT